MALDLEKFVKAKRFGAGFTLDELTGLIRLASASAASAGVVELATNAETAAGTDTTRAVTPAGLKALLDTLSGMGPDKYVTGSVGYNATTNALVLSMSDNTTINISMAGVIDDAVASMAAASVATETTAGVIEIATLVETQTGTDATRAVTPAGLKSVVDSLSFGAPAASATVAGIVELATTAEAQVGTDTTRAVTPAGLKAVVDTATASFTTATTLAGMVKGTGKALDTATAGTDYVAPGSVTVFTAPQKSTTTAANTGSFALDTKQVFKCTPTAPATLTFTGLPTGSELQSGFILLDNTAGMAISKAAGVLTSSTFLATVSVAGKYMLNYVADATNVWLTASPAMT